MQTRLTIPDHKESPIMSSLSSLGFFTLAHKGGSVGDENGPTGGETAAVLKDVLAKEYSAMTTMVTEDELMQKTYYQLQTPERSYAEVLHVLAILDNTNMPSIASLDIVAALHSGSILIPQIHYFEGGDKKEKGSSTTDASLPKNWQLLFVYQQLAEFFQNHQATGCACCLKALRRLQMRSPEEEDRYFSASDRAFQHWKLKGNEPLQHPDHRSRCSKEEEKDEQEQVASKSTQVPESTNGCSSVTSIFDVLDHFLTPAPTCSQGNSIMPKVDPVEDDEDSVEALVESVVGTPVPEPSDTFVNGMLLFTDCHNATHHFQPNFLPPYCANKRQIIRDVIFTSSSSTASKIKAIPNLEAPPKTLPAVIQCGHKQPSYSSTEEESFSSKKHSSSSSAGSKSVNNTNSGKSAYSGKRSLRKKLSKLFLRGDN
jgi:hypothetical protein